MKKYLKFLGVGLPAFALAVPINYALVEWAMLNTQAAYGIVLVFQVAVNFVMCRLFVFETEAGGGLMKQFAQFMSGILGFRILDWGLYALLVGYFGFYYIAIQVLNVFLFSFAKFFFAKYLFEGRRKSAVPVASP